MQSQIIILENACTQVIMVEIHEAIFCGFVYATYPVVTRPLRFDEHFFININVSIFLLSLHCEPRVVEAYLYKVIFLSCYNFETRAIISTFLTGHKWAMSVLKLNLFSGLRWPATVQKYNILGHGIGGQYTLSGHLVKLISKIQLVVYYQWCIMIGWATTRLYAIAH